MTVSDPAHFDIQSQCELGQRELMEMRYLDAAATLAAAEERAWAARDFDTLARLYMPLQEARRQIRQRCGEGSICLDLIAKDAADSLDPISISSRFTHGQLLVAGWGSIAPARRVRELQRQQNQYAETFLGAVYPSGSGRVIAIVPNEEVALPPAEDRSVDALIRLLPPHSVVLGSSELPAGSRRGTSETYSQTMDLWERLHSPFLAMADSQIDPIQKMIGYRKTIRIDNACELAHQKLSDVAKALSHQNA